MLKRELTELGRTVQRRGDIVYHLQEILERDEKRVEDIDRNTIKKTKMLVGGMGEGGGGCKEEIPAAGIPAGVTGQEQAGGGEEDHQPA